MFNHIICIMMKKFLFMFAACALFVACGGEKKEQTIEERCDEYAKVTAELTNTAYEISQGRTKADYSADPAYQDLYQRCETTIEEFKSWCNSLPSEDRKKVMDYLLVARDKYRIPASNGDFPGYY